MLDSVAWMTLSFLGNAFESAGGLLLPGLLIVFLIVHVRLRDRVTRLERRLEDMARDLRRATAGAAPSPSGESGEPPAPGLEAAVDDPWGTGVAAPGIPVASGSGSGAAAPPRATPPAAPRPGHRPDAASSPAASAAPGAPAAPPAAAVPPPASPPRSAPAPRDTVYDLAARFFAGGNWLVRGGIVLLFIGVGFLLKLAVDHALLPVPLRLAGVAAGGGILVWLGLRLAPARRAYGLALQGGGVGLVYLVLYAAFRLYGLLPAGAAFALMLLVVVAAGALALRQDARILAVLGAAGGFLAPLLASTGSGSHVMLFGYYAVLNAGVLGLALFRAWRELNVVGLLATFGIGALWGARFYRPEHFDSVEPFLVLFFLMYLAVAVLFALHRSLRLRDPINATLVFGNPLMAFGLQSQVVASGGGLAASALGLAAIYGAGAFALRARAGEGLRPLAEAFSALAVGFATAAIALHFDARWTSAAWALEGAALVWVGWRQRRALARLAGTLLQVLAGAAWLWHGMDEPAWSVEAFTGTLMLAVAGLLSGASLARAHPAREREAHAVGDERPLAMLLGLWGLMWWLGGGLLHIEHTVPGRHGLGAGLLFAAATALALDVAGTRLPWPLLRGAAVLLPGALAPVAFALLALDGTPLEHLGVLGWPAALAVCGAVLWRQEHEAGRLTRAMHPVTFWVLAALLAAEGVARAGDWIDAVPLSLQRLGGLLPPAALLALLARGARRRARWPFATHAARYLTAAAGPVVCVMGGAVFALSVAHPGAMDIAHPGAMDVTRAGVGWPIPYLPVLNPLDIGLALALAALVLWYRAAAAWLPASSHAAFTAAGAGLAFVWLNGALLRALHFGHDVPWRLGAMLESTLVQASLSVLWACTGLVAMVSASRGASRHLWLAGAGLMVVVVAKLMLVDLASTGTVARIVSFISVGLLLMLVGWLAPVPPRATLRSPSST